MLFITVYTSEQHGTDLWMKWKKLTDLLQSRTGWETKVYVVPPMWMSEATSDITMRVEMGVNFTDMDTRALMYERVKTTIVEWANAHALGYSVTILVNELVGTLTQI